MSQGDHIHMDGVVIDVQCGKFKVQLHEGQQEVMAQLAGKLRQNKIRVVLGDEVTVAMSPYDLNLGLIISRK